MALARKTSAHWPPPGRSSGHSRSKHSSPRQQARLRVNMTSLSFRPSSLLQRVAMRMGCMASWTDESVLQRPPSEDRGCHRERGMPNAQAARTFGVAISTVKRYAAKAQKGEPLKPGKAPGKRPKIDERVSKLLEEDLKERPFATLKERCEYVEAMSGVLVSRSAMCRSIARIGSTRKKAPLCVKPRRLGMLADPT